MILKIKTIEDVMNVMLMLPFILVGIISAVKLVQLAIEDASLWPLIFGITIFAAFYVWKDKLSFSKDNPKDDTAVEIIVI